MAAARKRSTPKRATQRRARLENRSKRPAAKPPAAKRPAAKRSTAKRPAARATPRWSAKVMQTSDAMDLEAGVFKKTSARAIAQSVKRSAEASRRRKSTPFRSAMSMLNFEINRAGKNLGARRKATLNRAKAELRRLFDRPPAKASRLRP